MRVNNEELREVLGMVEDVVKGSEVVEQLKAFHFLPVKDEGVVKVLGTDGSMTVLGKIPFEETDKSDSSRLAIHVDKITDQLKYMGGEDVEFIYSETSTGVELEGENGRATLAKHFSIDEDVDFDIDEVEDYNDELTVGDLTLILGSLSKVMDKNSIETGFKTIFLSGEKAISGNDMSISTVKCETDERYEFGIKVSEQVKKMVTGLDDDDVVELKKVSDESIMVRTANGVFYFDTMDVMELDTEVIDDFEGVDSALVEKEQLMDGCKFVQTTSEEDRISVKIGGEEVLLDSFYEEEEAEFVVKVRQAKVGESHKFELLSTLLLDMASIVDSPGIVLQLDPESQVLRVRSPKGKVDSVVKVSVM